MDEEIKYKNESDIQTEVPEIHAKNKHIKEKILFPEEVIDEIARKVANKIENTMPVRKIRRSQILTFFLGILGFSIFTLAITKMFWNVDSVFLFFLGLVLMIVSGVSLQNILKP